MNADEIVGSRVCHLGGFGGLHYWIHYRSISEAEAHHPWPSVEGPCPGLDARWEAIFSVANGVWQTLGQSIWSTVWQTTHRRNQENLPQPRNFHQPAMPVTKTSTPAAGKTGHLGVMMDSQNGYMKEE